MSERLREAAQRLVMLVDAQPSPDPEIAFQVDALRAALSAPVETPEEARQQAFHEAATIARAKRQWWENRSGECPLYVLGDIASEFDRLACTATPKEPMVQPRATWDKGREGESLDEIVAAGPVHLERMDDTMYYVGIGSGQFSVSLTRDGILELRPYGEGDLQKVIGAGAQP